MTKNMEVTRPKRSGTANVDYNLKKRRIIPSDDYPTKNTSAISSSPSQESSTEPIGPVILKDSNGNIMFQEPPVHDPINAMTGTPLSQRPKGSSNNNSNNNNSTNNINNNDNDDSNNRSGKHRNGNNKKKNSNILQALKSSMEAKYEGQLQTEKSNELTVQSHERIGANTPTKHNKNSGIKQEPDSDFMLQDPIRNSPSKSIALKMAKRLKSTKDKDTKLFGQNDKASHLHIPEIDPDNNKENDDFCSNCHGPGVFLCCDTCPKSFHFACCNPPLDPSHLPEGDWSCDECRFKQWIKSNKYGLSSEKKLKTRFLQDHFKQPGYQLFGTLTFDLQRKNPFQFQLPSIIKSTFDSVCSGSQGEYRDEHFKENINEKQIFHSAYGQSVTRMDSYQPEYHFNQDSGELLVCYHCGESKMGTWDHPDSQRLIITCDYCSTPWHLDCLPLPRASLKNLGSKWKCPLHAPLPKSYKRRLARGKQKYIVLPIGSRNNGDTEIAIDADSWTLSKLTEQNVALEFLDKVYQAKRVQQFEDLCQHSTILDKLVAAENQTPILNDISNLLYFQTSGTLKRLWDFKELCKISEQQLLKEKAKIQPIDESELTILQKLKTLLESKPKKEVLEFFKFTQ
ncbi:Rco1 [Kluyveromyces lactis]|nr:Rco1 [Kluyveromyces lactis]